MTLVGFDEDGFWTGELEHSCKPHINQQHSRGQSVHCITVAEEGPRTETFYAVVRNA